MRRPEEESIYMLARQEGPAASSAPAAPKIKTYNAPAPVAQRIRMHQDSSQVEMYLNPTRGIRDAQMRAGITPTDHAKANAIRVKEQSRLNALKKAQEEEAAAAPKRPVARSAPSRSKLLAGPIQDEPEMMGGRNFIAENRAGALPRGAAAAGIASREKENRGGDFLNKRDYGRLPQYLINRKIEMAADHDAAAAAKEAALIPPGMRLLAEEERLETLAMLEKNKAEVERQIQKLPIVIETPSMIRHRNELEARMREIEDAFKVFRRPKVLVQA